MFANAQVTLDTLVMLEDAFISAYLVGVRDFSSNNLKVIAARIMGIESAAAAKAGFDTSKTFAFDPFKPVYPSPLGKFHSFLV